MSDLVKSIQSLEDRLRALPDLVVIPKTSEEKLSELEEDITGLEKLRAKIKAANEVADPFDSFRFDTRRRNLERRLQELKEEIS